MEGMSKTALALSAVEHFLRTGATADLINALEQHDKVMSDLGKAFAPSMSDYRGNIKKIKDGHRKVVQARNLQSTEAGSEQLVQTLKAEKEYHGGKVPDPSCAVGLVWQCR